jgi:hypothetical protein
MAQIQQINLASLNKSKHRDGFHSRQGSINPSLINLTRNSIISTNYSSFFKSGQIKRRVFEMMETGCRPQNSLEINSDP